MVSPGFRRGNRQRRLNLRRAIWLFESETLNFREFMCSS